jgi:hypothetical protein
MPGYPVQVSEKHNRLRMRHVCVLVALVGGSLACPAETSIWIRPGSTIHRLEFGISDRRDGTQPVPFGALRVMRCSGTYDESSVVWLLTPDDSGSVYPLSVTYGEPPRGFVSSLGPGQLGPGCYRADILGSGKVQFRILADGSVIEEPWG